MKAYTTIEQSRKLAEILPIESADMYYSHEFVNSAGDYFKLNIASEGYFDDEESLGSDVPYWSLASLLEQLPYEICDDDGNSAYLQIDKEDDIYQLLYEDPHGDFDSIETDRHKHFVDACYELVLKVHESNLL